MVRAVRRGASMRSVALEHSVSVGQVHYWVARAAGQRLDRVDFGDRAPGCETAWNRLDASIEQRIVQLRAILRMSTLGEYGARAIREALQAEGCPALPSIITINRVLERQGLLEGAPRRRRAPPPKGWYLPDLMSAEAELDSFDFIEDLKIASGPLISVLTGTSLHGGLADAWPMEQATAKAAVEQLLGRWQCDGLPHYAQFDNGTQFQGAHQWPDSIGRVSRLCLALGVVPVFAPPREHGFQNLIEGLNGLWQAKVWHRHHVEDLTALQMLSAKYVAAHRARTICRRETGPVRRAFPAPFSFDLDAPLQGRMIFLRRSNSAAQVNLLGRSYPLPDHWKHRLTRCEVNFDQSCIRFFGLRRRDPQDQPLLCTSRYLRKHKPFKGDL
jgi:hypothetical protein